MKSKFMRMVGSGIEDEIEEETIKEETNQEKPQEIQVFQENEEIQPEMKEEVLPLINDAEIDILYNKFITIGFDFPFINSKRLFVASTYLKFEEVLKNFGTLEGGYGATQGVINTLKESPLLSPFIPEGLKNKPVSQFTQDDINTLITALENAIRTEQNEDIKTRLTTQLKNLKEYNLTEVAPSEDIMSLIEDKKNDKITIEKFKQEKTRLKEKYQVDETDIYNISIINQTSNVNSATIYKRIEQFMDVTQIKPYIEHFLEMNETGNIDLDKIEDMKNFKTELFLNLNKKLNKLKIDNKTLKQKEKQFKDEKNSLLAVLMNATLENPGIAKKYFDNTGNVTVKGEEITYILDATKKFVEKAKEFNLIDYDFTDTKEFGNINQLCQAMIYANEIATNIKNDAIEKYNEDIANKIYNKIIEYYKTQSKSLQILYRFFTGDAERVDDVIPVIIDDSLTINVYVEVKSSRPTSNFNADAVYMDLDKIAYLCHLSSNYNNLVYGAFYFNKDNDLISNLRKGLVRNVSPTKAGLMNFENFIDFFGFEWNEKYKPLLSKVRGRKETNEETNENTKKGKLREDFKKYLKELLDTYFKSKKFNKEYSFTGDGSSLYLNTDVFLQEKIWRNLKEPNKNWETDEKKDLYTKKTKYSKNILEQKKKELELLNTKINNRINERKTLHNYFKQQYELLQEDIKIVRATSKKAIKFTKNKKIKGKFIPRKITAKTLDFDTIRIFEAIMYNTLDIDKYNNYFDRFRNLKVTKTKLIKDFPNIIEIVNKSGEKYADDILFENDLNEFKELVLENEEDEDNKEIEGYTDIIEEDGLIKYIMPDGTKRYKENGEWVIDI